MGGAADRLSLQSVALLQLCLSVAQRELGACVLDAPAGICPDQKSLCPAIGKRFFIAWTESPADHQGKLSGGIGGPRLRRAVADIAEAW